MGNRLLALALLLLTLPPLAAAAEPGLPPGGVLLAYDPGADLEGGQSIGPDLYQALAGRLGPDSPFVGAAIPAARRAKLLDEGTVPLCTFFHARAPARENSRVWLAEMSYGQTVLARVGDGAELPAPGEPVLAFAGSLYEAMATQQGWQVEAVRVRSQGNRMLSTGRVKWWLEELSVVHRAEQDGQVPPLTVAKAFEPVSAWLACSPAVAPSLAAQLGKAFRALREDGSFEKLMLAYQLPLPREEAGQPGE